MRPGVITAASPSFGQFLLKQIALDRMVRIQPVETDEALCVYCDGETDDDGFYRDCQEFGA